MSSQCETTGKHAAGAPLGFFERYLTLWVLLCILVGIGLAAITVPRDTLLLSVLLYILVPLIIANLWYESRPGISTYAVCCPPVAVAPVRTGSAG